jgi:hypothetical protein
VRMRHRSGQRPSMERPACAMPESPSAAFRDRWTDMLSAAEPDRSSNNALLLPARNGALARSWCLLVFYLRYVKYTTPQLSPAID